MKKTATFAIAALIAVAPLSVSAAPLTDAQIMKLRQTCKGILCDTLPMTSAEKARGDAKFETAPAQAEHDAKQEIRDLKREIKELKKQLRQLEKELRLLLRK